METRVLIVEDERIVAEDIKRSLINLGYDVTGISSSGPLAVESALYDRPDIILMDIKLKGEMDGFTTAEEIRSKADIPIVYLTAYSDDDTVKKARETSPYGYILKPFEGRELHTTIQMALYRHSMEAKLRASEEVYRTLAENNPAGIFILHMGKFRYANASMERILELDRKELESFYFTETIHAADREKMQDLYERAVKGETPNAELRMKTRNGYRLVNVTTTGLNYHGEPSIMGLAMDVTEHRVLEKEARRAQKLDAMSAMGMGLAHEVNNILNMIIGASQLVYTKLEDEDMREWLREIYIGGKKCSRLVNQVLDVTGMTSDSHSEHSLLILLKGTVKMIRMGLPENVNIAFQADPGEYRVYASAVDLQSILIHLVDNAIDAMADGGSISIELKDLEEIDQVRMELPEGSYLKVMISDTGTGMSEEALGKALDPLHSTEDEHDGSGLTMVRDMVERNYGRVSIESSEEGGTTVTIVLPMVPDYPETGPRGSVAPPE